MRDRAPWCWPRMQTPHSLRHGPSAVKNLLRQNGVHAGRGSTRLGANGLHATGRQNGHPGLARHHALADARALMAGYRAWHQLMQPPSGGFNEKSVS